MDLKDKHTGEDFVTRVGQDEIGAILDLKETAAAGMDVRAKNRVPSWDQVYEQISRHGAVLQALLAPALSVEQYYQELLRVALRAGFRDPLLLLGLLWHAPHGDAQKRRERWNYLESLVDETMANTEDFPLAGDELLSAPDPALTGGLGLPGAGMSALASGESLTELFSFLEQRVIMDRRSYESLISELEEVSSRATDLQRQVSEWEDRFHNSKDATSGPRLRFIGDKSAETQQHSRAWAAALGRKNQPQAANTVQTAIQEFLKDNPDLAESSKVKMLQFCLKNYVEINPENSGLPFRAKLEMAAKLARDFLGERK